MGGGSVGAFAVGGGGEVREGWLVGGQALVHHRLPLPPLAHPRTIPSS